MSCTYSYEAAPHRSYENQCNIRIENDMDRDNAINYHLCPKNGSQSFKSEALLSDANTKYEATPILPKWVHPIMPERDRRHVRLAVQEGERGGRGKGGGGGSHPQEGQ